MRQLALFFAKYLKKNDSLLGQLDHHKKKLPKRKEIKSLQQKGCDSELLEIWINLRVKYFPLRVDLDSYHLKWSSRGHKRTLATCNLTSRTIIVARELKSQEYNKVIEPLLYHELCHAVLGHAVPKTARGKSWHGRDFKILESLHPDSMWLDQWIKQGGWSRAIKSDRAKRAWQERKKRRNLETSDLRDDKNLRFSQKPLYTPSAKTLFTG